MTIYDNGDWFKCSKDIIRDCDLTKSAKWLYVVLSCLNNQYGKDKGFFTRTNDDLMRDAEMSEGTLKKAKKELINQGYIKVWHNQLWQDREQNKATTFRICYYKLLK